MPINYLFKASSIFLDVSLQDLKNVSNSCFKTLFFSFSNLPITLMKLVIFISICVKVSSSKYSPKKLRNIRYHNVRSIYDIQELPAKNLSMLIKNI